MSLNRTARILAATGIIAVGSALFGCGSGSVSPGASATESAAIGGGDCCVEGPGCGDAEIEACVCAVLPDCCTGSWLLECVGQAAACGGCSGFTDDELAIAALLIDSDNDGLLDLEEIIAGLDPFWPFDGPDIDGDGIPNGDDPDVDGEGTTKAYDHDVDGDGIPNTQDDDIDGDGLLNEGRDDDDGDGVPDYLDDDDDADGSDGDGVCDSADNGELFNPDQLDCQSNGVGDVCDLDDETSKDCNENAIPDECDISEGTSDDCDANGTPDECEICVGDLNCDDTVGAADLAILLGSWGSCPNPCPADIAGDGDGMVGADDLATLLGNWGSCD